MTPARIDDAFSDEAFAARRRWFTAPATSVPDLAVELHTIVDDGRGETIVHHQLYDARGVIHAWAPGPTPHAQLTIRQQVPARDTLVGSSTAYVLADGVARDVFGLPLAPWRYDGLDVGDLACRIRVVCGAGPDGPVERVIETQGPVLRTTAPSSSMTRGPHGALRSTFDRRKEVRVNAPYPVLLEWLHGSAILGYLMTDGFDVRGDIWRLSAIEGLLAATRPAHGCDPAAVAILHKLFRARTHGVTAIILDQCLRIGSARPSEQHPTTQRRSIS